MQPPKIPYELTAGEIQTFARYANLSLPRHTSYPIAAVWRDVTDSQDADRARQDCAQASRPLSLYVHVPYCRSLCFYCACNKEIVDLSKSDPRSAFLESLEHELRQQSAVLGQNPVVQIHFGGGTPTFLEPSQLGIVGELLKKYFPRWSDQLEFSVEIDPRVTTDKHISALHAMGVNRVSLGVQDFAPKVQEAVNRLQSFELVARITESCRRQGISMVNFDLIYGLPYQTPESVAETIEKVISLKPDRIAFYRLAVIPEMFKWQKAFKNADLPEGHPILTMNLQAIRRFQEAGYAFIGLDHFALPSDSLYHSFADGTLRRNFQGMTTGGEVEILAFGPSAITQFHQYYVQNIKKPSQWRDRVNEGHAAYSKGIILSQDDVIRRDVLSQFYCFGRVDKATIEKQYNLRFDEYFAEDLARLQHLATDNLVTIADDSIELKGLLGRLLVRTVAAVFDKYLPQDAYMKGLASHQASKQG